MGFVFDVLTVRVTGVFGCVDSQGYGGAFNELWKCFVL